LAANCSQMLILWLKKIRRADDSQRNTLKVPATHSATDTGLAR